MINQEIPTAEFGNNKEITIQGIRGKISELMRGVPGHHGLEHTFLVEEFGRFLAFRGGANEFRVRLGSLLHDLRWWDDEERRARKIQPVASEKLGKTSAKVILGQLYKEGKIAPADYGGILVAIRRHGRFPEDQTVPQQTVLECLRDADRLSRSGLRGLISIIEANNDYRVPFYNDGGDIQRSPGSKMIANEDIKSCVDDINACLDWEKVMETHEGALLAKPLNKINREFLNTFSRHKDIRDYNIWLSWLRTVSRETEQKTQEIVQSLEKGRYEDYRRSLISLEDPQLVSNKSFEDFLQRT